MSERLVFDRLVHSDWSINPSKRWTATAVRVRSDWRIASLLQTPPSSEFLTFLFDRSFRTLAGFDFAVGLPQVYLDKIEMDFLKFLVVIGDRPWDEFSSVAVSSDQISIHRPFYPKSALRGVRRSDLVRGLAVESFADLLRTCERKTSGRRAASPIFWTLGGNQVGKAALSGWNEVLRPARKRGAQFWPFDGSLETLTTRTLTIAETYPAEAYRHIGFNLQSNMSKRDQSSRKWAAASIIQRCKTYHIQLTEDIQSSIVDGFGRQSSGEDAFDALAGLLSMIEVAEGRRPASPFTNLAVQKREGWILGQIELPFEINDRLQAIPH